MAYNPPNVNGQAVMASSAPVVIASNQTPIPVNDPDTTASGSLAALNATTSIALAGDSSVAVEISGTWVGTISFEGTVGGSIFNPLNGVSSSTSSPASTTTVNGLYRVTPSGLASMQVKMSAYTSGTATISIRSSGGSGGIFANQILPTKNTDGTNSQTIKAASTAAIAADIPAVIALHPSSPIPTGTNVIGALTANQSVNAAQINGVAPLMGNGVSGTGALRVATTSDGTLGTVTTVGTVTTITNGIKVATNTTGGATSFTLISAATTNATLVKASAGSLYGIYAYNNGAAAAYLKIFNLTVAPTVGTSVAVLTIYLPPSSGSNIPIPPQGIAFGTGISYSVTALGTTADVTAVAAAQVFVNGAFA